MSFGQQPRLRDRLHSRRPPNGLDGEVRLQKPAVSVENGDQTNLGQIEPSRSKCTAMLVMTKPQIS